MPISCAAIQRGLRRPFCVSPRRNAHLSGSSWDRMPFSSPLSSQRDVQKKMQSGKKSASRPTSTAWPISPRRPSPRCWQKGADEHVDCSNTADRRSTVMKYRLLGNSGLRVSEASLGTMTFGDEWGWRSSKDEAQKVYETYREAGGNFLD